MDFYDVVSQRRTVRDFADRPVETGKLRRILDAGMRAPSHNHLREWEFVVVRDADIITSVLKKIPKKVTENRLAFILKAMRLKDQTQIDMYTDAIPKQHEMLSRPGCLLLPFFRQKKLDYKENIGSLNAFASIWCVIENIFLAAAAEGLSYAMRIPFPAESEHIAGVIGHPKDYIMPCFISLGHPADDAAVPEQAAYNLDEKIHMDRW